eukprot:TRINITY_DN1465_c0_g1_i2.p1 TRINITY_DN1465_c0_g1~~TRINITY_DN1465_c0_g1_i2.p1  ORF type:complete len:523 (-),score=111.65 TRINITY_DN1465_c0_g1_i2:436-2004(-)
MSDGHVLECSYCHTRETPVWRLGPKGAKTLCNACGIRWKRNRQRIRPKKTVNPGKKKAKGKAASAVYRDESDDETDEDINEEEFIIPARQRAATAAAQAAIAAQAKQEASPSVSPSRSPSPRGSVGEKFVLGGISSRMILGRTEEPKKHEMPPPIKEKRPPGIMLPGLGMGIATTKRTKTPASALPASIARVKDEPSMKKRKTAKQAVPPQKKQGRGRPKSKTTNTTIKKRYPKYQETPSPSISPSLSPTPSSSSSSESDYSESESSGYSTSPSPSPRTTASINTILKKIEDVHQAQTNTQKRIAEMNSLIESTGERCAQATHNGPMPDLISSRDDPDAATPIVNFNPNAGDMQQALADWTLPNGSSTSSSNSVPRSNHFSIPSSHGHGPRMNKLSASLIARRKTPLPRSGLSTSITSADVLESENTKSLECIESVEDDKREEEEEDDSRSTPAAASHNPLSHLPPPPPTIPFQTSNSPSLSALPFSSHLAPISLVSLLALSTPSPRSPSPSSPPPPPSRIL